MNGPITIVAGDQSLGAYLAVPDSGSGPGVLVMHSWWGFTPFFAQLCERLASEGFVALAPDYFDGATARTPAEAKRLHDALDEEGTSRLLVAAAKHLRAHRATEPAQIGALAVSRGCRWALALAEAMPEDIAAAVLFYGLQQGAYRRSRAAFLGHFGKQDPTVAREEIDSLEAVLQDGGCEVSFEVYDHVGHSFFETDRPDHFDPAAAALAWNRTTDFLQEKLARAWAPAKLPVRHL